MGKAINKMKKTTHHNATKKYNQGLIIIHWITTILILILFTLGKYMEELNFSEKNELIKIHAILGILVFNLTIIRVYFYFKHPRPSAIKKGSKLNRQVIGWIHNAFYFLLLGASITGIASLFLGSYIKAMKLAYFHESVLLSNYSKTPLKIHGVVAGIMMVLLVVHVVGVLKHYLFTKENTLKRIT